MRKKGAYRLLAGLLCMVIVLSENSIYTLASVASLQVQETEGLIEPTTESETTEKNISESDDLEDTSSTENREGVELATEDKEVQTEEVDTQVSEETITTSEIDLYKEKTEEASSIEVPEGESIENIPTQEFAQPQLLTEAMARIESVTASNEISQESINKLFFEYPEYLVNDDFEDVIAETVKYSVEVQNNVDNEVAAAIFEGLHNGASIIWSNFWAQFGIGEDYETQHKKDMAKEILQKYSDANTSMTTCANEFKSNIGTISKIYDVTLSTDRALFAEELKKKNLHLSDEKIDKIVKEAFADTGYLSNIKKITNEAAGTFAISMEYIELLEIEERTLDDLIAICENANCDDITEQLKNIKKDRNTNFRSYFTKYYLVDHVFEGIWDSVKDWASSNIATTNIDVKNISTLYSTANLVISIAADIYDDFEPSVDEIIFSAMALSYYNSATIIVSDYQTKFKLAKMGKGAVTTEDIRKYEAAYVFELTAAQILAKYSWKIAYKQDQSSQLHFDILCAKNAVDKFTYTKYLNSCLKNMETNSIEIPDLPEDYDSTESIAAKFEAIRNQFVPNASYWTGSWGGCIQCFGFARMVFSKLFGCEMPSAYYGNRRYELIPSDNVVLMGQLVGSNVNSTNLKNLLTQGKLGDVIQANGIYGQHTMILEGTSSEGVTVYQCNKNGECGVYEDTYSWDVFANLYGSASNGSDNGVSLYRAYNYASIYGDGTNLFYDDTVNFVIDANGVLTKYNGWQKFVKIPDTVTAIGANAFKNNTTMISVKIPDSVTSIGGSAFYGCSNLVGVYIPDSVTSMGCAAFGGCTKLQSVSLSKNLKSLGGNTFINCTSLIGIEIPKSLESASKSWSGTPSNYGSGEFRGCTNLRSISFEEGTTEIPAYLFMNAPGIESITIPEEVTSIGGSAFEGCSKLKEVRLSNAVTYIDGHAFYGCALESIEIPDSVISMGCAVFGGCTKLQSVSLSKNLKSLGGNTFINCTSLIGIEIPKSLESASKNWSGTPSNYGSGEFRGCTKLKSISFEEGTTAIAPYLFMNTSGIEKVTIPESVTKIGNSAFYGCSNLVEVIIPNSVTRIDSGAFQICSKLKEINLSDSLTVIESHAFYGCALESVDIPDSVISMGCAAFGGCTKLESVDLSKNLKSLGGNTFVDCTSLTSIEIPKSLESASTSYSFSPSNDGSGEFRGCTKLKTIHFEEGTTAIVPYLFMYASGIENVVIPEGVTRIGNSAFYECKNLKEIILPDTLTTIENSAFYNCTSLKEVDIPDTVNSMGTYTFYNCTSLEKAHLPEERINVGEATFYNCSSLTEVNFPKTLNYIRKNAFRGTKISEAILPENIIGVEDYAFYNCDALTKVSIPDKTTSIGSYCFADCELLSDVKLGNGLTTIPTYAFNLCPSLKSIVIPYRVTTINNYAFTNCTELTEITIPRSVTSIGSSVFSYPTKLTIYGISRSYAESYAEQIGATFVSREVKATEVTFLSDTYNMNKGSKVRMVISVAPENFTDEIVWRTTDTDIISVDDDGVVTAKALGTAKVQVVVGDVSATRTITVRQPVSSISLNKTSLSLEALETYQLKASISPSDASVKTVAWSSSDTSVATVDENGDVTALAKGTAVVTATAQDGSGISKNCTVTVLNTCYVCDSPLDMESPHNYESNCSDSWIYTEEGANQLFVTFDDRTEIEDEFDFLYVYDKNGKQVGKYTGTSLAGEVLKVTGDTVRIKLVTDQVGTKWGFKVTSISQTDEPEAVITTTTRPYANIASGSKVLKGTEIILACDEADAQIYYTLDGVQPTQTSTVYVNPIIIQEDLIIKAIAVKEGYKESPMVTYEYFVTEAEDEAEMVPDEDIPEGGVPDGLWIAGLEDYTYTGKAIKPFVRVYDGSRKLVLGKDYTISYKNNTKANDASVAKKAPTIIVKGKGNYAGKVTATFKILPVNLEDSAVVADELVVAYNKKVQKKVPVLEYNGMKLVNKKDFNVFYPDIEEGVEGAYKTPGTYDIVLTAKDNGNYIGTRTIKLLITERTFISKASVKKISDQPYEGKAVEPELIITRKGAPDLVKGVDYEVVYENNEGIGTATAVITGIGDYVGTKRVNFKITGTSIKNAQVTNIVNKIYNGKEQTQNVELYLNDAKLEEGQHYKVTYSKNLNVGTANMVIEGINLYTGTIKKTFKITAYDLKEDEANQLNGLAEEIRVTYEKGGSTPTVKLFFGEVELLHGKDYKLSYKNNKKTALLTDKNAPTIVIKGQGNYSGTIESTFTIEKKDFKDSENPVSITVADLVVSKKAGKYKSIPTLLDSNGKKLQAGVDYEKDIIYKLEDGTILTKKDKVEAGEKVIIEVTGKGNYTNTIFATYEITKKDFRKATIKITPQVYTGQNIYLDAQDIKVNIGTSNLTFGKDYEIVEDSYKKNVNKGMASVTIRGIGNYGGTKTVSFKIGTRSISEFWQGIYAQMMELWN